MPSSSTQTAPSATIPDRRARVFVAEPNSRYNLEDAEKFGRVVYLDTRQELSIFQTDEMLDAIFNRLTEMEYDPDEDFFCLAGHMITVSLVLAALIARYDWVRTLMYDARASVYVERIVHPRYE